MHLEQIMGSHALVSFAVADTGIGFSEATRERLFQPFTQGDDSTTRKYGGTGLGLAICQRLIDLMNGKLAARSRAGQGSTFSFSIPLLLPAFGLQRPVPTDAYNLRGLRVLVVDDDAIIGDLVGQYLAKWNAQYLAVRNGEEALAQLRASVLAKNAFDAAIVDLMMPGLSGLELSKIVKSDETLGATRLIALTARRDPGLVEKVRQAGFAICLTKPISAGELFQALSPAKHLTQTVETAFSSSDQGQVSQIPTRVLLVEDNPTNQQVISLQLQRLGYEVQVVSSGQAALDTLTDSQEYRLVLMDCQMPEMDGFETTRRIRQAEIRSGQHVPIVALTANAAQGDREASRAAGMDDFIAKPVSLSDMEQVIGRWIVVDNITPQIIDKRELNDLRELAAPDNPNFLKQLVDSFLADSTDLLSNLRQAIDQQDAKEAFRAAHTLKSSSAMYGAHRLADLSKQLEKAMRGADFANSQAQYQAVEAEYQRVKQALIAEADK
jgi:CheY-like chemotaxis protein